MYFEQLPGGAEFLKVAEAGQDIDGLAVKGGIEFHVCQQVGERIVLPLAPFIEPLRRAPADVLDGGQCVRDRVGGAVDVEIAVVLAEPAGGDADAEAAAHLRLDGGDPVLIALVCVIGQEGDVILLRVVGFEIRAVEGMSAPILKPGFLVFMGWYRPPTEISASPNGVRASFR